MSSSDNNKKDNKKQSDASLETRGGGAHAESAQPLEVRESAAPVMRETAPPTGPPVGEGPQIKDFVNPDAIPYKTAVHTKSNDAEDKPKKASTSDDKGKAKASSSDVKVDAKASDKPKASSGSGDKGDKK